MPTDAFQDVKGSTIALHDFILLDGQQWEVIGRTDTKARVKRHAMTATITIAHGGTYKVARD